VVAPSVLVTGAAGYIGSHTVVTLARSGYSVIAVDDFSNSERSTPARIDAMCGGRVRWFECDVRDEHRIDVLFRDHLIGGVIHFAGLKSVDESCRDPLAYYSVNVGGTLSLARVALRHRVERFVFSSSATVYDARSRSPVSEQAPQGPVNPYGRSKLGCERLLADFQSAHPGFKVALLRYFNPVGADPGGSIGESPLGPPANLMPAICNAARGVYQHLMVFGSDYPTPDGTGVRDFVHVADLADAHVAALEKLDSANEPLIVNLGSGRGYSVLEMIAAFERANGVAVPFVLAPRREGDVAELWADIERARVVLGWRPVRGLDQMCRDAWRWASGRSGVAQSSSEFEG
jgi:UDP-glucose 4-epimerase